ncbi:hypothetical protein CVS29_13105 [Arthrobacter psychrochitiniphilus]|uniref:Endoribonuclease YoeB n=1 Tax=Arthrobacter psychrochitiniphilus TaxID=291045 RepID=A0A2V3DP37_9MICC|nr:hypothetical protein CVS29_13105 [Arthrobacter psychrochitiniphilus]
MSSVNQVGPRTAWSRRITKERRLGYLVQDDDTVVLQAWFHHR